MVKLKLVSWNINGLNACYKKGLIKFINKEKAHIYCLQETRAHPDSLSQDIKFPEEYKQYWFSGERKGYSGVLTLCKKDLKPISIIKGINDAESDAEGRILTLEFDNFYLINAYIMNASRGLVRLDQKLKHNQKFLEFCNSLREKKPIIACGDFNVAHTELDIANPESNRNNAGFTDQEREFFTKFLANGYIDTFRMFVKE